MATVFARTIIIYILLLGAMRLMGKRQVGELEVSELVTTFMLSELAVLPIANKNAPLSHSILPVLLLLSVELIFSYITSKSNLLRKIMLGKPNIIIRKGVLDEKELSKLRMSVDELMSELRLKGVSSPEEVDYAIVEDNGQLSVIKRAAASPLTPPDLGLSSCERGIAHCVVADGKISGDGLSDIGKTKSWLNGELEKRNTAIEDIRLMTVDDGGTIFIIMKGTKN